MKECIDIMQRMPTYKNKVWEKIMQQHTEYEEAKGEHGKLMGDLARKRLVQKNKDQEEEFQKGLDSLILKTAETSALKAMNLNQLLKKKWSEEKNAYQIMSKIQTEKQTQRLRTLLKEN